MNVISVDLESWVHRDRIKEGRKRMDDGSVLSSSKRLLALFDKHDIKTTFFVVGEVYDWYPELIEEIKERGHEIAYHTNTHVTLTNKDQLSEELKKSHLFLKKFRPNGFRAPNIFLKEEYLKLLYKQGFKYDSSTYGPFDLCKKVAGIVELPVSTYKFRGNPTLSFPRNLDLSLVMKEIPFGSGYFIGVFGSKVSYFIRKLNADNVPAILFVHPWQIRSSPDGNFLLKRLLHHVDCYKTIDTLLTKHNFCTCSELVREVENNELD